MNTTSRAKQFDHVLQQYSGAMFHYLYSLCKDWQVAEELSQDLWAFVDRKFTEEQMLQKALLYRKAKQVFIDHWRKTRSRVELVHPEEPPDPVVMPVRQEPENTEEDKRLFDSFWEIFHPDKYDETSKLIFWLKERYGYSLDEIATAKGIGRSTVHDKLTRIKEACKRRLELNKSREEDARYA